MERKQHPLYRQSRTAQLPLKTKSPHTRPLLSGVMQPRGILSGFMFYWREDIADTSLRRNFLGTFGSVEGYTPTL
jgi:hypothetical protein